MAHQVTTYHVAHTHNLNNTAGGGVDSISGKACEVKSGGCSSGIPLPLNRRLLLVLYWLQWWTIRCQRTLEPGLSSMLNADHSSETGR
jgi:hypothetical protein